MDRGAVPSIKSNTGGNKFGDVTVACVMMHDEKSTNTKVQHVAHQASAYRYVNFLVHHGEPEHVPRRASSAKDAKSVAQHVACKQL
jgi:hypothetical protein